MNNTVKYNAILQKYRKNIKFFSKVLDKELKIFIVSNMQLCGGIFSLVSNRGISISVDNYAYLNAMRVNAFSRIRGITHNYLDYLIANLQH